MWLHRKVYFAKVSLKLRLSINNMYTKYKIGILLKDYLYHIGYTIPHIYILHGLRIPSLTIFNLLLILSFLGSISQHQRPVGGCRETVPMSSRDVWCDPWWEPTWWSLWTHCRVSRGKYFWSCQTFFWHPPIIQAYWRATVPPVKAINPIGSLSNKLSSNKPDPNSSPSLRRDGISVQDNGQGINYRNKV